MISVDYTTNGIGVKFVDRHCRRCYKTRAVLVFSLITGLVFGTVSAGSMVKLEAPSAREKREAIAAAFVDRFVLGFVIGPVARGLDASALLIGVLLGLGLSVPAALISRAYVPILAIGTIGGLGVGVAYVLVY